MDDKHLHNAENITPVIRSDKLNDEVRGLLDAVSARLSTENLTELVGKVVVDRQGGRCGQGVPGRERPACKGCSFL